MVFLPATIPSLPLLLANGLKKKTSSPVTSFLPEKTASNWRGPDNRKFFNRLANR